MKPNRKSNPGYMVACIGNAELNRCAKTYTTGHLIDIGCGDKGRKPFFETFVDSYTGLDHEFCPHGLDNVDIIASAYNTKQDDESYDTLLCTAVLEHLEEPQCAIAESFRILKPNGIAIYTAPMFWHLHEQPRDFYRYTKYGLTHLFTNAGFEMVECKALSGFIVTFGTELNYYIKRRLRWRGFGQIAAAIITVSNTILPRLDRGRLRDEAFPWMHLVVARKPADKR